MRKLNFKIMAFAFVLLGYLFSGSALAQKIPSNDVFNIEDYAGKVVYVDLWASWCIPCRDAFPFLKELTEEFGDELAVVAINVDEYKEDALMFLERFEHPFEIVFDPDAELVSVFEPLGMPTSYLFDRQGNLVNVHPTFLKEHIPAIRQLIADTVAAAKSE